MPVHQTKDGKWQWGEGHGSFDTEAEARKQEAAKPVSSQ